MKRIRQLNDEKGSASIFLVMILASVIALVLAFSAVAGRVAGAGYTDGVLNLAARSVLSEYDTDLKNDYGIIAFRGCENEITDKLAHYTNYTLDENEHLALEELNSDTGEHSLINIDVFEKEITEYTMYAMAKGILDSAFSESNGEAEPEQGEAAAGGDRVLRNRGIIESLPSAQVGSGANIGERLKDSIDSIDEVFKKGTNAYFVGEYIMTVFKNSSDRDVGRDTFFEYEAEYILAGEYADEDNRKKVRSYIVLFRNAVNYAFIFLDPVKRLEVLAAAELLTPGPPALATQFLLAEAWALAEAENDARLLEHGKRVALYKTKASWAVDLQSIINNKETEYIDTGIDTGLSYEDYLRAFLFFQDRAVKLTRIMDLIQINMKGNYNAGFLIRDMNCGFKFNAVVNGREYVYEHEY